MSEQTGTFYAVSVGPGDPELLTLQAVRVLENTPVIAAPQTASGQMLALDIARGAVDLTGRSVLPLRFTMSHDAAVRAESYRAAASAVEAELRQGRDVAMVNLGDVALFATAYYIFAEIERDGFPARMLPGVTSVAAVAARLGQSLTEMEQPLHILPASCDLDAAPGPPGHEGADEIRLRHPRDCCSAGARGSVEAGLDGRRLRPAQRAGLPRSAGDPGKMSAILPPFLSDRSEPMQQNLPRLILAGTNSGCGKTTVTCAVLQALVNRGLSVAAAKCGPDYIDPMFHSRIIGAKSSNLDPFFFDENTLRFLLAQNASGCDVTVIEGVMGYYDASA